MKKIFLFGFVLILLSVFSNGAMALWGWNPDPSDWFPFGHGECNVSSDCGTSTDCVQYICMGVTGSCFQANAPSGTVANGPNECKSYACDGSGGMTVSENRSGNSCGTAGSGSFCVAGNCYTPVGIICPDGDACTTDNFTSPIIGFSCTMVQFAPPGMFPRQQISCDDGNPDTIDSCNSSIGCVFNPAPCNDQNACTSGDVSTANGCIGTPVNCNDSNPNTVDSCNSTTGCSHVFTPVSCNDQDACTDNDMSTISGGCIGTQISCDDQDDGTADSCNPATGCSHVFIPVICNDNDACTSNDLFDGSVCSGTPISCDDGDVGTADSCNPATGCSHVFIPVPCDDQDACTDNDMALGIVCSGTPIICNDQSNLTADSCNPATGCVFTPLKVAYHYVDGTELPVTELEIQTANPTFEYRVHLNNLHDAQRSFEMRESISNKLTLLSANLLYDTTANGEDNQYRFDNINIGAWGNTDVIMTFKNNTEDEQQVVSINTSFCELLKIDCDKDFQFFIFKANVPAIPEFGFFLIPIGVVLGSYFFINKKKVLA